MPAKRVKSFDNRQCVACGSLIFQYEDEDRNLFAKRETCRTDSCRMRLRQEGPKFPQYREAKPASGDREPIKLAPVPESLLIGRRVPSWLFQPVENSVENPVSV
jgi:hypothetical protein